MARKRKRHHSSTRPVRGWAWMVSGLSIGLVIAAAVYFSGYRAPALPPASVSRAPSESPAPPRVPESEPEQAPARDESTATEPHPASRFDFYDMLSRVEVVIPDAARSNDRAAPEAIVEDAGNYLLQAGSFTVLEDADRMQATLALMGIESHIQRVPIDDDIYHRVRIGPIDDLEELNRIRRRLWDEDIQPMLLRVPN